MKILIDECLPKKLKRELPNHDVATVREKGWQGKKNGVLLRLMSGAFDVFITVDKNLKYQQNLQTYEVAVVVLRVPSNKLEHVQPLMPQVLAILEEIQSGDIVEVPARED